MSSELLSAKTEKFKSKEILSHIYIYNEKPSHILEIYG